MVVKGTSVTFTTKTDERQRRESYNIDNNNEPLGESVDYYNNDNVVVDDDDDYYYDDEFEESF